MLDLLGGGGYCHVFGGREAYGVRPACRRFGCGLAPEQPGPPAAAESGSKLPHSKRSALTHASVEMQQGAFDTRRLYR